MTTTCRWMDLLIVPPYKLFLTHSYYRTSHFTLLTSLWTVVPSFILPILDFSADFIVLAIYEMLRHIAITFRKQHLMFHNLLTAILIYTIANCFRMDIWSFISRPLVKVTYWNDLGHCPGKNLLNHMIKWTVFKNHLRVKRKPSHLKSFVWSREIFKMCPKCHHHTVTQSCCLAVNQHQDVTVKFWGSVNNSIPIGFVVTLYLSIGHQKGRIHL